MTSSHLSDDTTLLRSSSLGEPPLEYAALVVNDVDENALISCETKKPLPVQNIKLSTDILSEIAIVSWRWDGNDGIWGSRNIFHVIRVARDRRIRFLLIDSVSIDQKLRGTAKFLNQVVVFSKLYKIVPVIVAYDTVDNSKVRAGVFDNPKILGFRYTLFRPWIFNELRTIRYNPTRVLYVGHNEQGAKFRQQDSRPLGEAANCVFGDMLPEVWKGGFTNVVLGVLCGNVGMTSISDFKFIMPALAGVLELAYQQMEPNDYLLTTAILCQTHWIDRARNNHLNDITEKGFNRYRLRDLAFEGKIRNASIYLDTTKIAKWWHRENDYMDLHRMALLPEPNAAHLIFTALGLTDSDFEEYSSQQEERTASLLIDQNAPLPRVEFIESKAVTYEGVVNS